MSWGTAAGSPALFCCFCQREERQILWGCSLLATIWVLRYYHLHLESHMLWKKLVQFGKGMERNRRMFEDYIGTGVEELWERVTFWSALWASVLLPFKDCFSYILLLESS